MEFDYFEGRPQNPIDEHRRRLNAQIHERYRIRDMNNPMNMSINEFIKLYRMPQHDVLNLCYILRPYVPQRTSPQQTELFRKVLVTLSFLACGSYQRMLGRSIDVSVSQSSVSRFVKEIITALNHPEILTRFIRFPMTAQERAVLIQKHEDRFGLPRVLACMDGFLVRLSYLKHNPERQGYLSRKGFLALNNQIICDSDLTILNIESRWPGSCNDQYMWNASPAKTVVQEAYWQDRCWLLGDSGYSTAPWLHIPLPHAPEGTPEYDYTMLHCRARNCVECCIGVLKSRWRLLGIDRCIHYKDPTYAGYMVNACCVLHNYCKERGVPNPAPILENIILPEPNVPDEDEVPRNIQQLGQQEMNFLINHAHARRLQLDGR